MKFEKIHNKGQAQLFKNPVLEMLTKTHPLVIWGMYLPVVIGFPLFAAHTFNVSAIRTLSHTDYTDTAAKNYRSTQVIWNSILDLEEKSSSHLNGFILLMHIGAGPGRRDKFFHKLPALLNWLKLKRYKPVRIDELLN